MKYITVVDFQIVCIQFHSYRCDINLPALLDTEIWKASVMLNQKIPSNRNASLRATGGSKGWKDFGVDWTNGVNS